MDPKQPDEPKQPEKPEKPDKPENLDGEIHALSPYSIVGTGQSKWRKPVADASAPKPAPFKMPLRIAHNRCVVASAGWTARSPSNRWKSRTLTVSNCVTP